MPSLQSLACQSVRSLYSPRELRLASVPSFLTEWCYGAQRCGPMVMSDFLAHVALADRENKCVVRRSDCCSTFFGSCIRSLSVSRRAALQADVMVLTTS